MITYKLQKNVFGKVTSVFRSDGWAIPFSPDNTDYANFKRDIADGAELQDADGNVMTADAAKAFVGTLP